MIDLGPENVQIYHFGIEVVLPRLLGGDAIAKGDKHGFLRGTWMPLHCLCHAAASLGAQRFGGSTRRNVESSTLARKPGLRLDFSPTARAAGHPYLQTRA